MDDTSVNLFPLLRIIRKSDSPLLGFLHLGDQQERRDWHSDVQPYSERSPRNNNTGDWLTDYKSRLHGRPLLGGCIGSPPRKSHQQILSPGQIYLHRSSRPADFSTRPVRSARTPFPWVAYTTLDRSLHFTPTAGCQQSAVRIHPRPVPNRGYGAARSANPTAFFGHWRVKMGNPLDAVGGPWTACQARRPLGRPRPGPRARRLLRVLGGFLGPGRRPGGYSPGSVSTRIWASTQSASPSRL